MDILDILLDEENDDVIVLRDQNGQPSVFGQIAVIPYNDLIYCLLHPLKKEGASENDIIVFWVDESGEEPVLRPEGDFTVAAKVFGMYVDLAKKNGGTEMTHERGLDKFKKLLIVLFDNYNRSDLVLVNEDGKELVFAQVYAAAEGNDVYCILAPRTKVSGMDRNDALLFSVARDGTLTVVTDRACSERIFAQYYRSIGGGYRENCSED